MFDMQFSHLSGQTLSVLRASNEMDSTLLITGSTGTGKSHLAYAVHKANLKRSSSRWFKVNLATLSENLIESELFGHERGAFTGADAKRTGRLEACNGGTIFLDEIGELPLRLQAKLLDFIQYKKITPVGSNREIELDVRIIAATNRNLELAVKAGEFRADLYHRLNVFHVRMPELSINPKSVITFARAFLNQRSRAVEKLILNFSKEVEQVFRHYSWPGNIRELENTIEFIVAMETTQTVKLTSLPAPIIDYIRTYVPQLYASMTSKDDSSETNNENLPETHQTSEEMPKINSSASQAAAVAFLQLPMTLDYHESKDFFEKAYLEQALKIFGGQINLTSRRIGLNKVSMTEKIKRHAIDWRKIRYESLAPATV